MPKHYSDPRLRIFSLNSNRPLAEKIADAVSVEPGKCSVAQFSDGKIQVNIEESIRGAHVYAIQSTSDPVNDNLMGLLIMIDALKRASVKTTSAVMPYYGCTRQDHKTRAWEPTTAKLVANITGRAGATKMLILNLHAVQIQGFFDIPAGHLVGTPLVADYFIEHDIQGDDVVVVSPDRGGVTHVHKLAGFLRAPTTIIDRRRPKASVTEVMNIIDHVEGETCILIDDVIDAAGTVSFTINTLKEAGAKDIYASCTHPVLSGPALQRIGDPVIGHLVVIDSIYLSDDRRIVKTDGINVGELIGDAIKRIHENKPVNPLFETRNR